MDERTLPLLCDPETHDALELNAGALLNPKSGRRYPIRDGIPIFLEALFGSNKKYQELYDRIALFYDPAETLYRWLFRKRDIRTEYLRELEVGANARVLEVSVGTGANIPHFRSDSEVFGLDISWGMLKRCRKRLARWKQTADLFQGEAESLPFRDGIFDVVFHVGGINFFNDRARAIAEMIRVAKPGTKIVIVDETEKVVKEIYEKTPFTKKVFSEAARWRLKPSRSANGTGDQFVPGKILCAFGSRGVNLHVGVNRQPSHHRQNGCRQEFEFLS